MVKVISVKCPECGANISIDKDRKSCFCNYCGTQIILDDGSRTITHHKIDEAKIREAEAEENVRLKELELEEKKLKIKWKILLCWVVLMFALGIMAFIVSQISDGEAGGIIGLVDLCVLIWGIVALVNYSDNSRGRQ